MVKPLVLVVQDLLEHPPCPVDYKDYKDVINTQCKVTMLEY